MNLRGYIRSIQAPKPNDNWIDTDVFDFITECNDEMKGKKEKGKGKGKYKSRWIICNALGGGSGQAAQIASNPDYKQMKLLPYGGVAARIDCNVPWQLDDPSENEEEKKDSGISGLS